MADLLVGLLLIVIGLVICMAGLRVFILALPLLGFVTGFYIGAAGVRTVLGDGFLSSATGVIIGLIVGVVGAGLSYLFWYAGALLAAGSSGALAGSGLLGLFGVDSGWGLAIAAAIGAIVAVVVAWLIALPVYIVIVNTAFAGAAGAIAGALLVFDRIDRVDLGYGAGWAVTNESWWWLFAWLILATAGVGAQLQSIAAVQLPAQRWAYGQPS